MEQRTAAAIPARNDYGSGCYRRRIVLKATAAEVRGELADDFHHFAVRIGYAAGVVTDAAGEDVRVPWTSCPGAVAALQQMEGAPLSHRLLDLVRFTPPRAQCTHLHDLACLAIRHAARVSASMGAPRRIYDVSVPDRVRGATNAAIERDGVPALSWRLLGSTLHEATPDDCVGLELGRPSFHRYLLHETDADRSEAAWILERAVFVATGRRHDFDQIHEASTFAPVVGAACHTFAPANVAEARRVYGTVRDFTSQPERIFDR